MANTPVDRLIRRLRSGALEQDGGGLADGELLECYVALRDEAAFAALVRRHGPMVFGVCRRILRNDADAEDAFQATFLVLVRKANSIRPKGMVSNWLYGVAHNTALKAKAMIHKRRLKETEAGALPKPNGAEETWSRLQGVVDAELSRLPDKYRVPIVLCDLEGKTIKEAMRHLGWPQGTIASRLTRGRALLARRLTKHGLTLSAALLAGALTQGAASASVPAALTASTVQAAALFTLGKTAAAGTVSASALALADGMLKSMLLVKLKLAAGAVLLFAVLGAGIGGIAYHQSASTGADPAELGEAPRQSPAPQTACGPAMPEQTPPSESACKPPEPPSSAGFKVHTIVIQRGVNLHAMHSHLKKLVEQSACHVTGHYTVVLQRSSPTQTQQCKPEGPKVVIRMSSQEMARLKCLPEGKELPYMFWQDANAEAQPQVVAIRTTPAKGGSDSPSRRGAPGVQQRISDIVWVIVGRRQEQGAENAPQPACGFEPTVLIGGYPLAPLAP